MDLYVRLYVYPKRMTSRGPVCSVSPQLWLDLHLNILLGAHLASEIGCNTEINILTVFQSTRFSERFE